MIKQILIVGGLAVALAAGIAVVFEFSGHEMARKETATILRGQNAFQIANDLKAEGYIESKILFLAELIRTGNFKKLKSGEYDLVGLDCSQIINKMVNARTVAKTATIIPGQTIKDIQNGKIAKLINLNDLSKYRIKDFQEEFDFLRDLPAGADLEGYLFPDTYELPENPEIDYLIAVALKNFDKKMSLDAREKIAKQNRTIHDVVIMASILEKEVKTLEDKKIVAGILYKRLDADMPLQVDSTLLYYKVPGVEDGRINKEIDSPYNTYKYAGWPAGPICNPDEKSFEGAIEPIETSYWYYLSTSDGATIFSKTYNEHLTNIAQYLH